MADGGGSWTASETAANVQTGGSGGGLIGKIASYEYSSVNNGYTKLPTGGTQILGGEKYLYAGTGQNGVNGIFGLGGANGLDADYYSLGGTGRRWLVWRRRRFME